MEAGVTHGSICVELLTASSTPWDKRPASDFRQAPAIRAQTIVLTPPFKLWFEIGTPVQQRIELRAADIGGLDARQVSRSV